MNKHVAITRCTQNQVLGRGVHRALKCVAPRTPLLVVAASLAGLAAAPAGAGPFPAEFELSDLLSANGGDGSSGLVINGINIGDNTSTSLGAAGDVNGDGIDDLILGTFQASPGGRTDAGESYVVFGTTSGLPAELELSTLLAANGGNGSAGVVLSGIDAEDRSGFAVAGAGDLNADGISDFVIGAPHSDPPNILYDQQLKGGGPPPTRPDAGEVYVVFGTDQGFPAEFDLASLLAANGGDGSSGFVLSGSVAGDNLGRVLAGGGDINNDGVDDLLVAAPFASPAPSRSSAGQIYVVFGNSQGFPAEIDLAAMLTVNGGDGSTGFVLNGIAAGDVAGISVSGNADINGDGIADVVIGAERASPGGRYSAGQTYVFFGADQNFAAEVELSSLLVVNGGDGSDGMVMHGIDNGDDSGASVSAGDLNGDGFSDVIIGAEDASPGGRSRAGESYVIMGSNQPFAAEILLSDLMAANGGDGSLGFVLNGIDQDDSSGRSVSAAGDINGDGLDDIIVGAYYGSPGAREYAGETYVVFGTDQGFPAEFELASLQSAGGGDGTTGFVLNGIAEEDYSGLPVSTAGDFNGDGIADLLLAAQDADASGRNRAGQTYLVLGRGVDTDGDGVPDAADNCTLIANADQCDTNADGFGNLCDPDINNDNTVNMLDLGALKAAFFSSPSDGTWDADADMNCNGVINFADLAIMKTYFFGPPGPSGTTP